MNIANETNVTFSSEKFSFSDVYIRIALYTIIFLLSVMGNSLVILTLLQNRRMRTITNVFLLNLAISDLFLAVFCMPFTLVPTLLKDFIFGYSMCVLIRYLQGVCVAVSVFTLVSMSLERYFAICQPLTSRTWQTLSHSYKIITAVWIISFFIMIPIAIFQKLKPISATSHKCLEEWSDPFLERLYTLFLDIALLVCPLILMFIAYMAIALTLWKGIRQELCKERTQLRRSFKMETAKYTPNSSPKLVTDFTKLRQVTKPKFEDHMSNNNKSESHKNGACTNKIRQSNSTKSLTSKKRVIRMLVFLVMEFFVCWTPMYILQTWFVFDHQSAVEQISPVTMNFIHLLSYVSACCNPITYCFMNKKFRQGFLSFFRCCGRQHNALLRRPSDCTNTSPKTGLIVYKDKKFVSKFKYNDPPQSLKLKGYNSSLKTTETVL